LISDPHDCEETEKSDHEHHDGPLTAWSFAL